MPDKTETIVAIATPPGRGGIGIVRLAGQDSSKIALTICKRLKLTPRVAHYSTLIDLDGTTIDYALVIYFKAPNSFTGEDLIEFHAHGSPIVLDLIVTACIKLGARIAKPGEFSLRAYLNNKIDLTQAEAIADLINANSQNAARMAVRSLQGEFSKLIEQLNEKIVSLRLYVEAAIDFSTEDLDFITNKKILQNLEEILSFFSEIYNSAKQGAIMRDGLTLVIAGLPNSGKSTLINQLAKKDLAIVTEIAGTTRDLLRENILIDELPITIVDTAGLRESNDLVEQEGIKRARLAIKEADCILMVIDSCNKDLEQQQEIIATIPPNIPIVYIYNKIDLVHIAPHQANDSIYISAKSGAGIVMLKEKIKTIANYQNTEGQFLARKRHLIALEKANKFLLAVAEKIDNEAFELLAEDLRLAHQALEEITGKFSADDLLGKIFSSFCIGK